MVKEGPPRWHQSARWIGVPLLVRYFPKPARMQNLAASIRGHFQLYMVLNWKKGLETLLAHENTQIRKEPTMKLVSLSTLNVVILFNDNTNNEMKRVNPAVLATYTIYRICCYQRLQRNCQLTTNCRLQQHPQ